MVDVIAKTGLGLVVLAVIGVALVATKGLVVLALIVLFMAWLAGEFVWDATHQSRRPGDYDEAYDGPPPPPDA